MQDLAYILSLTTPVFMVIAIGYLVVRAGLLNSDSLKGFAWFLLYVGLPAAMFKALSSRNFQEILNYDYLLAFALGSLVPFVTLFAIGMMRGSGVTKSAIFGMGGSLSNSLMVGFPIIMQLFGEGALVPFALTLIVENLIILPLALALAESGEKADMGFGWAFLHTLPQLFKNPIILAILIGTLFSFLELSPPAPVGKVVDMLSATAGGIALFTIGGMLVGLKPRGMVVDVSSIVAGKLLLHPLGVFVAFSLLASVPEMYRSAAIVLACMPMFSIYPLFGARFGLGGVCSAVILPAMLAAFITINLTIWLINV